MPWFWDWKAPHGTWLRRLVVLGLVVAVVAETPLRSVGVLPAWLTLDSTGTVAGSVLVPGSPDEAELAAAAQRKGDKQGGDKQDKGTDKSDQKAEKSDKRKSDKRNGGTRTPPGEDQDRTPGGGNGKPQEDGKRDTPQRDKDQGDKQITPERKGKDTTSERRGAADVAAADVAAADVTAADVAAADVTAAATVLSFPPVADAQVNEANPNTNFGGDAWLTVDGGTDPDVFSYLRFSVSGVSGTVQRATLRLWVRDSGGTQDGPFVKTAGTGWSETGITWNNRPGAGKRVLDDKGALTGGTWVEYDVTRAVNGNGAVGFTLRPETNDSAVFASREAANTPQLVLTLDGGTTPTPTPGPNPTPTPVSPTPTPTPTATPPPTSTPVLGSVAAADETTPVHHGGDAADDPAIWIHPTDPGRSTIIGTDKLGGLAVYDLAGNELAFYADSMPNNVDLRYNFPLGGNRVALVVTSDTTTDSLRTYRIDPATRQLTHVAARTLGVGIGVAGLCMYVSPSTGKYYAFVGDSSGTVQQWELYDNGSGKVDATRVRTLSLGSTTEGCVADDATGNLYIAEEDVGIWKYGAEPNAGSARTRVDVVGSGGHLTADIEGLAIYYRGDGSGYLLASSQGNDKFVVYERGGTNAYVMTFAITAGSVDGVSHTDGLDVTNAGLGTAFPNGLFIAQDDRNDGGNQNFKLVPWGDVARAASPALAVDTGWDPRRVGA